MKFKIRFSDQIVGFFVVLSLVALLFVVAALGSSQRWFARDLTLITVLPTATGLSKNMPLQYRGFNIGTVKDFRLKDNDEVEVFFVIYEEYKDRAKQGSIVEMVINPLGLGNQFMFHSGKGEPHSEGDFVPAYGSEEAMALTRQGLAAEIQHDESMIVLLSRARRILFDLVDIASDLREAMGEGSDATEIGRIVGSVQSILASSDNFLNTLLDTEQDAYKNLLGSLQSVASILDNLDKATGFVPGQLTQLAGMIVELRDTIKTAEDLMTALTNNPLLRGGVSDRPEVQDSAANPRGIRF